MKIRTGIVGIGRIAQDFHIPILQKLEGFDLCCGYDSIPARRTVAKQQYGLRVYSELKEFLASDIELVVIASPSNTHKELALKSIHAGKNVVIEKPMALSLQDTDEIIEQANKKRVLLSVSHSRRWDSDFLTIKKLLQQRVLGKLVSIESRVLGYGSLIGYAVQEFDTHWRYKSFYGGGVLYDMGSHLIDQLLSLIDQRVVGVWCNMQNVLWSDEVDDYFKCLIRFEDGLVAQLETSQISKYNLPRWYIVGSRGAILCENWDGPVKVMAESTEIRDREFVPAMESGDWAEFYKNIYKALTEKAELIVKPQQVRRTAAVIDAAKKSHVSAREVKILI
ncbi:MAG: Gfo/Idh/MocA family oxidoreductase [Candidatus Omnitrophota bacterium]